MKQAIAILYFILLSILLRWPMIPYLESIPMEANFPLHALAAFDLASGGSPFVNLHLEWPFGAPIRYLAWPLLLIAIPFNWILDPIPAMNLAIAVWLTVQGYGVFWLLQQLQFKLHSCYIGSSLALLAPQSLIALGNGQFENIAPFPLLLCYWASSKNYGWLTFLALMACCFSSPYVGLLGLLLVWMTAFKSPKIYLILSTTALITFLYYGAVSNFNVHESTIPAPASTSEKATILGLLNPANIAENGGVPLAGPIQRLQRLTQTPAGYVYDNRWPWLMATAGAYLGWIWLLAGAWGCWASRKENHTRILLIWGIFCILLSLGATVRIFSIEIPMPWSLGSFSESLSQMQATSRFLAAASLLLALGVALIPKRKWAIAIALCCSLEALLVSPSHWPVPTRAPMQSDVLKNIQEPVIFWPAAPIIASHKVTMTSLLLKQPLALFSEKGATMPDASGNVQSIGTGNNRRGHTLSQWRAHITSAGASKVLQFRDVTGAQSQPFNKERGSCDASFCIWSLP